MGMGFGVMAAGLLLMAPLLPVLAAITGLNAINAKVTGKTENSGPLKTDPELNLLFDI